MSAWRKILTPLASLRLTITLLAASMFLVLAGTVAQIDFDVFQVQKMYFHSWWTWVPIQSFFPRPHAGHAGIPGGIPFLGGYTLIFLLLANLLAAHAVRFKFSWKRSGVLLIHFGLVLLLVGEVLSSQLKHEGQMVLTVGDTLNYAQDPNEIELAVVDRTPADHDDVAAIPGAMLKAGETIRDGRLPFDVRVDDYWANSTILGPFQAGADADPRATAGAGMQLTVKGLPLTTGTDNTQQPNTPSAYVTFLDNGNSLGTYLISESEDFEGPQEVKVGAKTYWVELRPRRYYKPYTVTLLKFEHDDYIGSDTAKNFASYVRIIDPAQHVDREAKIWMNHPLYFDGDSFYQQSFLPGDKTTVLQVVKNPGWRLPYIACAIGALGLLFHFGLTLITFLRRRSAEIAQKAARNAAANSGSYTLAAHSALRPANVAALGVVAVAVAYLVSAIIPAIKPASGGNSFDYANFGRIPVTYDGRTMPLDSLARNSLRIISGIEEVHDGKKTISADQLLAAAFSDQDRNWVRSLPMFTIDHPDIKTMLGLDVSQRRFSDNEIFKNYSPEKLFEQAQQADKIPDKQRDPYQQNLISLVQHLILFGHLVQWEGNPDPSADWEGLYLIAPLKPGERWQTYSQLIKGSPDSASTNVSKTWLDAIMQHGKAGDAAGFNTAVGEYLGVLHRDLPQTMRKVDYESFFNRFEPFYLCMILYVSVFVLAALSWLLWPGLGRATVALLIVTLLLHTFGLASRIYLMGRPPVTNLYSSAIFIGWGAVVLALGIEFIYRDGLACALAAVVGFVTIFIAHNLALNPALTTTGDTMEMMRAVLDTNLWLATHVVCITLGYATTFLTGVFAIVFVIRGIFDPNFDAEKRKSLSRKIYGTLCFAMFFSFVGTILGGIWADQSWGRFWGWDPKENGAILVVLWNALILHARWSGIARQRGVAVMAIFGNIVTSWSWFGTNMLGIGLHSYGFMAGAATWLIVFMASQLFLIAVGMIPIRYWRAYSAGPA
ncbi:MAG TPA: cytochrome c biogenesis protein CcsA [Tepidisphaeraceae bacterium]|nr:cytochrome c biogenesis protein CcsA [Tepidisphaeraceae bacterium]